MTTKDRKMNLTEKLNENRNKRVKWIGGKAYMTPNPEVTCVDGFTISIQCQEHSYCTPRLNLPDVNNYEEFELGYPSELDELISEYAECEDTCNTVFPYVPRKVVEALINKHGGIA